MKKISPYITILLCIVLFFGHLNAGKRRRRPSVQVKQTTTGEPASTEKSKRVKKTRKTRKAIKRKGSESAEELFIIADSLFSAGDSASAAETMMKILRDFPKDTMADKALISVSEYLIAQNEVKKALELLEQTQLVNSENSANVELLKTKTYASIGRVGYALLIARRVEVQYAGTKWAQDAHKIANKLSTELKPIIMTTAQQTKSTADTSSQNDEQAK